MKLDQRRQRRRSIIVNRCNCGACSTCNAFARRDAQRERHKVYMGLRPADRAPATPPRPVELTAYDRLREATAPLLLRRP